ncbi:hypothetical protein Tco_1441725, partial [Tanacetum coccineum]
VHLIRNLNGTLSIAFIIRNVEITLRLEEFARILRIPCEGVCVFTPDWPISSLPNGIDSNPDIYPPPIEDPLLIRDTLFYQRPPGKTRKVKGVATTLDPFQMVLFDLKDDFKKWETILSENVIKSSESPSPTPHQEEENDPVNIYTLDPIVYIDQLPPIEGGIDVSPLAPRALIFSTPPSSPFEPHPYLTSLEDIPPRSSNPPPPSSSQGFSQTLPQQTPMDFEPSFPPINLSRSRLSAQPEPFMSREQVLEELSQLHTFSHNIEEAI